MNKRQLLPLPRAGRSFWRPSRSDTGLLPLPRAGRSDAQGILPMPRTGRSDGLLPLLRTGRSEGLLPMPRSGRSSDQGLVPMPRTGRSEGMLPFPRAGRSEGMLPFPRAGRSEGMLPFPRAGRSEGMLPFPRAGRSEGMLPFPRAGRSEGMLPFPRAGRSSNLGMLPMPRTGRSEGIVPFPRSGRSTDGLVPMPRAGRSLSTYSYPDCSSESTDCIEMHDSLDPNLESENDDSVDNYDNPLQRILDRSKRSMNETSLTESSSQNETDLAKSVDSIKNSENETSSEDDESNRFVLNGMTIVLKPKPRIMNPVSNDDMMTLVADAAGRERLERHWIEFEKGFSFRYPFPYSPTSRLSSSLSTLPGSPASSSFFSNSLEDELETNNLDPIDLQLRAVYIPRIGKRTQTGAFTLPNFSTADWFKRTGTSGSGPAFQPRIGRSSFFQPRTGRSMNGADDDDLNIDEVILDGRPARSSFTPRIGRSVHSSSVKGHKQQSSEGQKTTQASS